MNKREIEKEFHVEYWYAKFASDKNAGDIAKQIIKSQQEHTDLKLTALKQQIEGMKYNNTSSMPYGLKLEKQVIHNETIDQILNLFPK